MSKPAVFSQSFFTMGTRCEVVMVNTPDELAERSFQVIRDDFSKLERLLSRFIPGSALNLLNNADAEQWLEVPEELWNMLVICRDFFNRSFGAFDISASALINLWKDKPDDFEPDPVELSKAKLNSGFDKIKFDTENKRIFKNVREVEFDPGAIGKGFALDQMRKRLADFGIKQAFISFGESSVMGLGAHPAGPWWPVGIPNAMNLSEIVRVFEVKDEVVTTSGTLLNSSWSGAKIRRHVIDPRSGFPVLEQKIVSVKSGSATLGEFLSTTLLVLGEEERKIFLSKVKNVEILIVKYSSERELDKEFIIL